MKIGILTFHNVTNYGAALQCYGVQALCRKLVPGAQVEVINYQPGKATAYYLRRHMLLKLDFLYPFKVGAFTRFQKQHFTLSGEKIVDREQLKTLAKTYDVIIVGSDEVWKIGKIRGWDPSFFLDFADASKTKLISYAASSDKNTSYAPVEAELRGYLARFSSIAVRDGHTRNNIQALVSTTVNEVLDPTLVSDYEAIRLPGRVYKAPYVLVYASLNAESMATIKHWAKQKGWKIVSIGHNNALSNKTYSTAGPKEWLNLIQNAELVVSNYFHGILLSLKYKVPLLPLYKEGKMAKIGDIAEKLGFTDKICRDLVAVKGTDYQPLLVDYTNVDAILDRWQKKSIDYLKQAITVE